MSDYMVICWDLCPKTATEIFGTVAFFLNLGAYFVYGKGVLSSKIRPNVATWALWLVGSYVELVTYDAIKGSHWSTTALPVACFIGIALICLIIGYMQVKNGKTGVSYHKPVREDYELVSFDFLAWLAWKLGMSPTFANAVAVGTSIFPFIPIWRTTYHDPKSEHPLPWVLFCLSYVAMVGAVVTGPGGSDFDLYIYPVYYLALHGIVLALTLRTK